MSSNATVEVILRLDEDKGMGRGPSLGVVSLSWILRCVQPVFCKHRICSDLHTLIFSNSAVNVVVYSILKRDIRMELKRLLRCPAHQESLGFGLVHLRESIRANRPLDMGTDVSMRAHQEPGHTSNQSGLERVI